MRNGEGKVAIAGDPERSCGLPRHALHLARYCPLAEGLSGRFREGNYRKNIRSEYCRLLYPFRPLLILRDAHEQLVGHMRMSLYTSRSRERQCSLFTMRSQYGHTPRGPTEIYFHRDNLMNATFGVLAKRFSKRPTLVSS